MNMFKTLFKRRDFRNAEIHAEITALKDILRAHGLSLEVPETFKKPSEVRTWYISRLVYIPGIVECAKKEAEVVSELKATIRDKDKEIETLKTLLQWIDKDEQEWVNHKDIFNFMAARYKNNKTPEE